MIDLKISGDNWDASQNRNDLKLVRASNEVSQSSAIRLLLIEGEQFDDTRVGVPWLTDMVSTHVGIESKREIIRNTIINTFGVKSIESLVLNNENDGNGTISFNGTTENNEFFNGVVNA